MFSFVCPNKNIIIAGLFLLIFNIIAKELKSQSNDTIRISVTENIYDTIFIVDTVMIIDTVWIERKFDNLFLSASYSPFFADWRVFKSENLTATRKTTNSVGLDIGISKNNWSFTSGVKFNMLLDQINFDYYLSKPDSVINEEITPGNYYLNDTVSSSWEYFLDYTYVGDSLVVEMDSVQHFVIDSLLVADYDTTYFIEYDTVQVYTSVHRKENFRFVEVPFVVEYRFAKFDNLSLDIGAGFIAGFLIKSESFFFDVGTNTVKSYAKSDTYRFMPSLWFSLGINYKIGDALLISLEPYYNPGLKSIYKKELSVIKIPDRYGLRFVVRYYF